ncbi:hypothetical protein M409DRAFT_70102 [Zasmidium cellare ATCC 36951]|uniref:C2H2-type domain-containing protein n=1 Tax=Zasmidium cellare ATCC 36951 TaxID=1080233 RepID=A0A6A6C6M9_ZASCE|nr:uncharacterized protein M409DRAFT_70102 [Zasmidium cellare ATCC 36951]KAF2161036.1 hypothetical protein M409DRAFT_70102 [Zasmidium cellare ATCC 36951]
MAHTPKYTELESEHDDRQAFNCLLPPHSAQTFATYADFEIHYTQTHTNRCRECNKNFPSDHFLDLHLTENHDPIVATRRDNGEKTYVCFVEGCDKVCQDWKKRRNHLVDKHGFPRNYNFFIVNDGIDGRYSMLRRGVDENGHRKSSRERGRRDSSATVTTQTTDATSLSLASDSVVEEESERARPKASIPKTRSEKKVMPAKSKEVSVDAVTKSMSSLQFVPRSVTFGKKKGKSGFAKQ